MTSASIFSGRVHLYFEPCCFLVGWTIDDAVLCFMFGPVTVEVWW